MALIYDCLTFIAVSAIASPVFEILSPSEPILKAKIENMISPDYVLCYIPRALEALYKKMKIL